MSSQSISTQSVYLKYGLILGLISIAINLVMYATGLFVQLQTGQNLGLSWGIGGVSFLLTIALAVMACLEFRKQNNGLMSFGQGFIIVFLAILISSALSSVFQAVYTGLVDPTLMDQVFEAQRQNFENQGLSEEQIETAQSFGSFAKNPLFTLAVGIFSGAIIGAILALIISAIMKRDETVPKRNIVDEIGQ